MTVLEQREAVAKEALTWVGTPFHDNAALKGVASDCIGFIAKSFNTAIGTNLVVRDYPYQWFAHSTEEIYLNDLIAAGFVEITPEEAGLGDIVVSKVGEPVYCHGGLLLEHPEVIHASSRGGRKNGVVVGKLTCNWFFTARQLKFFKWGGW